MPVLQMLLGALILSSAPLLIKPFAGEISPVQLTAWRMGEALLLLLLFAAIHQRGQTAKWSLPIRMNGWQFFGATMFGSNAFWFSSAMLYAPTAVAYVIATSTPAYMLGWQLILGKKWPRWGEYLIAAVIAVGLLLFFFRGLATSDVFGIACAVLAGLSWAGYIFAQGRLGTETNEAGLQLSQGTVLLGTMFALPWLGLTYVTCRLSGILPEIYMPEKLPGSGAAWILILLLGFTVAVPAWLWAKAIPRVSPHISGSVPTLSAVWGTIWATWLLGEPFGDWEEVVGMILVHGAVLTAVYLKNRKEKAKTDSS